uniref:BTB domain-containing protein n=1 Tax=Strongyloides papillosus TaxID=174720 RepID=A0A0N5C3N9_STREA
MVLEIGKSNDDSCNIETKVKKLDIIWSIQNFSQRSEKTGEKFESQTCLVGSKDRSEWYLRIYPNGSNEKCKDYVSVFLVLKSPDKAKAIYGFSILNNKEEKKNVRSSTRSDEFVEGTGWGYEDFVKKDFLLNESNGLLSNDKLKILCEVEITEVKSDNPDNPETSKNITIPQSKLSSDYGNLFDSTLLYDCVIKVEDTEIKVHKAVLAARSTVFSDTFNSTKEESQTNIIEVREFRVDVVKKMLEYIYKDEISDIQNMDNEMFEIANRYELHRLKAISEQSMCTSLTIENVLERFALSDKYPTERLKNCCEELILKNMERLTKTKEWKKFVRVCPSLLESLLLRLANISSTERDSEKEENE